MQVSEHQRRVLFEALETNLGSEPAYVMMELLGPLAGDDIARKSDITGMQGEIAGLKGEFADLKGEFADLKGEFADLRGDFAGLRGEFTELRAEFRGIMPRVMATNIASMMGMAGLVIASAKFL